jgi:hypothetical protein
VMISFVPGAQSTVGPGGKPRPRVNVVRANRILFAGARFNFNRLCKAVRDKLLARRDKATHTTVVYLRSVGGGLSLLGFIGVFPFPQLYWWCIGAFYLGLILLTIEAFLENWMLIFRLIVSSVWLAIGLIFTLGFVAVKAPVSVAVWESAAKYPPGTVLGDIQWSDNFYELRVSLENESVYDYEDLSVILKPDKLVAKIGQISGPSRATFEDPQELTENLVDIELPSLLQKANPLVLIALDTGYRVRCDRLPSQSRIELIMALVDMRPFAPCNSTDHCMFAPEYKQRLDSHHKDGTNSVHWFGHALNDTSADNLFYRPIAGGAANLAIDGNFVVLERTRRLSISVFPREFLRIRVEHP